MSWIKRLYFKQIAWLVIAGLFIMGAIPARSMAYVVGPAQEAALARGADIDRVQRVLESKVVAERLGEMGLTPEQVTERLDRLTDSELHGFASTLDALYPGGGALSVIIALLVIVVLVLLILKITDKRIIIQ